MFLPRTPENEPIIQEAREEFSGIVYNRCATDVELFAIMFFPHYCKYQFNAFHRATFSDYKYGERAIRRAKVAPRGFAKSTLEALIKPIHDVCYKLEKFIVIISNTEAQTVQKLKDIQTEFITNDFLISIYGRFIQGRKAGSTDFIAVNEDHQCRFLALGSGTEMRGIRFGDVRPTKIILDDVEHSEEVNNEAIREKMSNWFKDVVSKIGDGETNISIVGTILHQKALLVELTKNPIYKSMQFKAIISWAERKDLWKEWENIYTDLDNENRAIDARNFYESNKEEMDKGVEVLWPDKEPYYKLQEEIIESGMRSFMKEKQNDPQSDEEKIFSPDNIWWYRKEDKGLFILKTNTLIPWVNLTAYGAIDPATGQTKASNNKKLDFTSIVSGYVDLKKRFFVDDVYLKRVSPTQFIQKIFELQEKYEYYKFGVETNLYRNLLMKNILDEKERIEKQEKKIIKVKFYDIDLNENKEKRIYSLEPKIFHGHILLNEELKDSIALDQLYDFPKGVHDDFPDSLHLAFGMVIGKYAVGGLNK